MVCGGVSTFPSITSRGPNTCKIIQQICCMLEFAPVLSSIYVWGNQHQIDILRGEGSWYPKPEWLQEMKIPYFHGIQGPGDGKPALIILAVIPKIISVPQYSRSYPYPYLCHFCIYDVCSISLFDIMQWLCSMAARFTGCGLSDSRSMSVGTLV